MSNFSWAIILPSSVSSLIPSLRNACFCLDALRYSCKSAGCSWYGYALSRLYVEYLCLGIWPLCYPNIISGLWMTDVLYSLRCTAAARTCFSVMAIEICLYSWALMAKDIPGVALLKYCSSVRNCLFSKYTNLRLVWREEIFHFVIPNKFAAVYMSLIYKNQVVICNYGDRLR